ncbi:MAG TPA: hypothetical protein VFN49_12660 [Candidatus Aquilonibacter sp.]|nr:hypothetical protein [Candidatus Aquilonibacter sp.]
MGKATLKRFLAAAIAAVQIIATIAVSGVATVQPALAATWSCQAGKDGSPGTLSGVYNTYFQPAIGFVAAGSNSLTLTIDTAGGGASTAPAAGDLLLVIQMQDGSLNSVNSSSYGMTSAGNAGLYEYVQVASVSGTGPYTVTIAGAGASNGFINSYDEESASGGSGQKTYQVVRVPQYVSATLSSTFRSAYWDGATGGIAALDIASTLNLGGASIYATGNGFRGGGVSVAGSSPASVLNNDWVDSATMNGTPSSNPPGQGFKGEGILGTPAYTFGYTSFTTPSSPASPTVNKGTTDGYPGGDMAMGSPGDAGGGGSDDDPKSNDQNTGGGGGSNGGAGGNGGYPWTPQEPNYPTNNPGANAAANYAANDGSTHNADIGGRGATAMSPSAARVFMGGGGGAGSNNNGSQNNSYNAYGSSGGVGGGIVMMRIANTSGSSATIYANGTVGLAPDNDGGGGGGAGGSVVITSPQSFSGITVYAQGAAGTSAYNKSGDTSTTTAHGPGGGGGGGAVYSSSPVSATVTGGTNGTTVYGVNEAYGATSGQSGVSGTISYTQVPGVPSGAECYSTSSGSAPYVGPIDTSDATYNGAEETGSYDGSVTATNNNDFTARSFVPSGATFINSGTVPGTWSGNTLSGTGTVSVGNAFYYDNTTNGAKTVTLTATAPTSLTGWTVRLCPDNAGVADCSGATTTPFSPSTSGSTSSASFSVAKRTAVKYTVWAVYSVPANTVAFNSYDAVLAASVGTTVNYTHNELYAGFIPITKQTTVVTTGCPSGQSVPSSGVCPGGIVRYTLDYRNIMKGGGLGTEGSNTAAFLVTAAGQLTISDDGTTGGNWGTTSNGLTEALRAGLGSSNTTCGAVANTCGDSTSGTLFTSGGTAGATAFAAQIGGATFQLVPPNVTGTSQGTITFAVTIK